MIVGGLLHILLVRPFDSAIFIEYIRHLAVILRKIVSSGNRIMGEAVVL